MNGTDAFTSQEVVAKTDDDGITPNLVVSSGRTLLPGPLASLISTVTGASSLTVRIGSKVGGFWIAGARETTLASLELTRAAIEAILTTAGRDVSQRRRGELGRSEAESVLERSISALHSTIATVSFLASSSFYLSAATLDSASSLSIQGLSTLNAILGSTESSRAVAAIITLIRDELNRPEEGNRGEVVGYLDLFSSTIGFVLLQRWGRRKTELDFREKGGEEVLWDTVIDDKGFRADVVGTKKRGYFDMPVDPIEPRRRGRPLSFLSPTGDEEIEALERGTIHESASILLSPHEQTTLSDEEIRQHIINQLPEGARAVITSETITAKTIKVDIFDTPMTDVSAPPGTVMIAERFHHPDTAESSESDGLPQQTILFRTALKRSSSAEIEPADKLRLTRGNQAYAEPDQNEDLVMMGNPLPIANGNERSDFKETETPISDVDSDSEVISDPASTPIGSLPKRSPPSEPVANQKKSRKPVDSQRNGNNTIKSPFSKSSINRFAGKGKPNSFTKPEKGSSLKKALKSLSPNQSSTSVKELSIRTVPASSMNGDVPKRTSSKSAIPRMTTVLSQEGTNKPLPQSPAQRSYDPVSNSTLMLPSGSRPSSRQNYYSVHEKRRDSVVSETFSTHTVESRPGSPSLGRTHMRSTSGLTKTKSEVGISVWASQGDQPGSATIKSHQRSTSFAPSFYSMAVNGSDDALILAPKTPLRQDSIFEDFKSLAALVQDGKVPGIFPNQHLVRSIRRFARFSSASYGASFLRFMGLTPESKLSTSLELQAVDTHHEHNSFLKYTGLPAGTIILSSFVDPQGATGLANSYVSTISPLVHFISIDHDSHAVVLTCRGTLGFEDVLTDMLCDYDDLYWQGKPYKVHKGIHASARRLLGGTGSRVMATLKAALEEYPTFGLILCGHSLGGAVASLLALLISEPSTVQECGALFATAPSQKLLSQSSHENDSMHSVPIDLPAGRPIHVYTYGTPATVSPSLRIATRGLITTIVNSADIVPSLSLGTLHDFRSVALNLKTDTTGAINSLKTRVWQRIRHAVQSAFYVDSGPPPPENTAGDGIGEDTWAWAALKTLRAGMSSEKLVPPGEVFVVETTRVFDRQATSSSTAVPDTATERVFRSLGRPATRVQLKYIRDVETRFGELRFGRNMFTDHSPGRYEASLAALEKGILEV